MKVSKLIPVPAAATIREWHWWVTAELNMSEGERALYYGNPLAGTILKRSGKLFEIRLPRARSVKDKTTNPE